MSAKDSASKIRRWHAFAEELLWNGRLYTTMQSLPANFWRVVDEIAESGWLWPPIFHAQDKDDGRAAARAAREVALLAIADHAATKAAGRAAGAVRSGQTRKARGENAIMGVERWEREHGRLTPQSPQARIALCGAAISKAEITVLNALRARARSARSE